MTGYLRLISFAGFCFHSKEGLKKSNFQPDSKTGLHTHASDYKAFRLVTAVLKERIFVWLAVGGLLMDLESTQPYCMIPTLIRQIQNLQTTVHRQSVWNLWGTKYH